MCLMSIGKTFEHTFSRRLFAPFRTRKRAVSEGLRHARMNVSAGLRHAYATLSLLRVCFCVVKSSRKLLVPDPATVHCGQRYDRKAGSSPFCQVAENSAKKLKYFTGGGASLFRHVCMLIQTKMHDKSDMEA